MSRIPVGTRIALGRAMEIAVHLQPSQNADAIVAFCPDLPGCSAVGKTQDAALSLLRERVVRMLSGSAQAPLPPGTRRTVIVL
jgi:hypothetical protein